MIEFGRECPVCRSFWPLSFYRWWRRRCVMCAHMDPLDARLINWIYLDTLKTVKERGA